MIKWLLCILAGSSPAAERMMRYRQSRRVHDVSATRESEYVTNNIMLDKWADRRKPIPILLFVGIADEARNA